MLRALVAAYVGEGGPVGSKTLSHLLPFKLSAASIRGVLAELGGKGLIEQPHTSAGRVPTEGGLRIFLDELLEPPELAPSERRDLAFQLEEASADRLLAVVSDVLTRHTQQLGFAIAPRLETIVLQHLAFVRLTSDRVLAVLVSSSGEPHQRVIEDKTSGSQADLERLASLLNERIAGRTLAQVRERLEREAEDLRSEADVLRRRALQLGLRATSPEDVGEGAHLVVARRLALFDQPEFHDPDRLREVLGTLETHAHLLEVLDDLLAGDGVAVGLGQELAEPGLRGCAVVVGGYGGDPSGGAVGVIGPQRMNYGRIIPLVAYCSELVGARLRRAGTAPDR
ncbi:MAG: heat-inducible transcriptional repressor HrcA [Proteobacteria bacterium]|nr:heat-inducible transcriptional repressor HrcA [Pseudomonadota bacterium]